VFCVTIATLTAIPEVRTLEAKSVRRRRVKGKVVKRGSERAICFWFSDLAQDFPVELVLIKNQREIEISKIKWLVLSVLLSGTILKQKKIVYEDTGAQM
jgi:hypothetical protein